MLDASQAAFLLVLRSALTGKPCPCDSIADSDMLCRVLFLSDIHELCPLICQSLYQHPVVKSHGAIFSRYRNKSVQSVSSQIVHTAEFLQLYQKMGKAGLKPLVVKGIVLRSLYPKGSFRPSVDEDLLIAPEEKEIFSAFLMRQGLFPSEGNAESDSYEISYLDSDTHLCIELHKSLFPPDSNAYGDLNHLFDGVLDRTVEVQIEDVKLRTLAPTDHLLYLICHAYKHFLHSGVGIRQVADMALFSNAYGGDIDWEHIYRACKSVNIETFTAALFQIAHKHLTMNEIPAPFVGIEVDEQPLLEDILSGGLYGTVDIDRVHSGNMTLDAVAAQKQGRRGSGVWHSLFPGAAYLQGHFPYAKKHPILLPLAWAQRLGNYLARSNTSSPAETIRIGQARIDLLKQYKVI